MKKLLVLAVGLAALVLAACVPIKQPAQDTNIYYTGVWIRTQNTNPVTVTHRCSDEFNRDNFFDVTDTVTPGPWEPYTNPDGVTFDHAAFSTVNWTIPQSLQQVHAALPDFGIVPHECFIAGVEAVDVNYIRYGAGGFYDQHQGCVNHPPSHTKADCILVDSASTPITVFHSHVQIGIASQDLWLELAKVMATRAVELVQ